MILKSGMKKIKETLKHAFALEPAEQESHTGLPHVLERLAATVVEKKMETPALLFLETMTPLNFLGSQFMYATMPFVQLFSTSDDYHEIARALENRKTVRLFAERIEELSSREFR